MGKPWNHSIERRTPLKRGKGPKRGKRLRKKGKRAHHQDELDAAFWAWASTQKRCQVTGRPGGVRCHIVRPGSFRHKGHKDYGNVIIMHPDLHEKQHSVSPDTRGWDLLEQEYGFDRWALARALAERFDSERGLEPLPF